MPFAPGQSGNPAGRKPGALNKLTKSVKDAFEAAFNGLQEPGEDGKPRPESLPEWAKKNPTEFYRLCRTLIPQKLEHSGGMSVTVGTGVPEASEQPDVSDIA